MTTKDTFKPSARAEAFLKTVENGKYKREIVTGLNKFLNRKIPAEMDGFYTKEQLNELLALRGTGQDVESRMPVKITRHYFELAKNSLPLQTLVKASPKETYDLEGAPDPGKQMDYSPVEGLIHKYELGKKINRQCAGFCKNRKRVANL